jgi:acyl-coenzyme A thioesterase PaaI-like protein
MTPEPAQQRDFMARVKINDVAIARLIGFETKGIAAGRAVLTLAAGPQHANPMGTLHGGVLCDVPTPPWESRLLLRSRPTNPSLRWS